MTWGVGVRTRADALACTAPGGTVATPAAMLLGCRTLMVGLAMMVGIVLGAAAGAAPGGTAWGGCVRDCWLFSSDSLRAGRLFCLWGRREK